jgi:hypothetical protein
MGGALRGAATGDAALALNPSGMSLVRTYAVEASYLHEQYTDATTHNAHVSIVDSTSGFNLGGGVYYTYRASSRQDGGERSGHEAGVALSFPFFERLMVGGTVKYFRLSTTGDPLYHGVASGFSFDAGLTLKPVAGLGIGLCFTNINDLGTDRAPRTVGGGVSVGVIDDLLFTFDAMMDFTATDPSRGNVWNLMGGGEYLFARRVALRMGGGRRGDTQAGYLAGGLSVISEVAALDVGVQQDLGGTRREWLVGVSARIFVPSP